MERKNVITSNGNPLTLLGPELKVGDKAPDFTVLDTTMQPVTLKSSAGKIRMFSVAPSLDTSVCDIQTVTFNKRAAELSPDIELYSVSMDLPFALGRYCAAKAVDRIQTVSDYREVSFGTNYGLLIKELRLLARAVVIVDAKDVIRYVQIVPEMSHEPNYDDAIAALKKVVG